MDNKFYVSLEAEELLIEKGYHIEMATPIYNGHGDVIGYCPADRPTKAEAIDWLESNGIVVELSYDDQAHMDNARWEYFIYTHDNDGWVEAMVCSWVEDNYYKTRLEAEEAAIIKALELLKGKEE